jgi:hypothetical protein
MSVREWRNKDVQYRTSDNADSNIAHDNKEKARREKCVGKQRKNRESTGPNSAT